MKDHLTVLTVLVIVVGLTVGVAPVAVFADQSDAPPADETFSAAEGIDVWERAFLPLRADAANDAVETVPNADWRVRDANDDETTLNRDPAGIYGTGQPVTLEFDLSDAGGSSSTFGNVHVELIAAHVEETGDGTVPGNVSEALDLLTLENANENASFEHVNETTLSGSTGDASFEYTPSQSGVYVFFLSVNESGKAGFQISGGNVTSVDGNVSIIGVEAIGVRSNDPDIDPPEDIVRGNSDDFVVSDPGVSGSTVHHLVVLYEESTYTSGSFVLELEEDPNAEFDVANNSTLLSSIDEVNGVATLEDPVEAFGVDVNDGSFSGTATVPSIVEFVAESASTDQPQVQDLDPGTTVVLHGSATAANGSPTPTLTVETFGNWSTGQYRWVYIAVSDSSGDSSAETGTLTIEAAGGGSGSGGTSGGSTSGGGTSGGGTSGGGGGGGGQQPPPPPPDDGTKPVFSLNVTALVENVSVGIRNASGNHQIPIEVPATGADTETNANLTNINFTLVPAGDYDMSIAHRGGPPADVPGLASQRSAAALRYVEITHTFADADAEGVGMRFRVRKAALEDGEQRPENVALYRYSNGAWAKIDAELLFETEDAYHYSAAPPGLSTFAIGVGEPALAVSGASLSTATVDPGGTIEITGTVENTGDGSGEFTAELVIDGEVVDDQTVELAAGDSTQVQFERTFESPGSYDVSIGDVAAGTVSVQQPVTPPPEQPAPSVTPAGGFNVGLVTTVVLGTVLVVFVVLSSLYMYHRRYE